MSELTEHRKNLPPDRHNEVWYKGELLVSTTDGQYAEGFEDGFDRALDMLAAVTQERLVGMVTAGQRLRNYVHHGTGCNTTTRAEQGGCICGAADVAEAWDAAVKGGQG